MLTRKSGEPMHEIRDDLKTILFISFGIFREEQKMKEGMIEIQKIKKRFLKAYNGGKKKI